MNSADVFEEILKKKIHQLAQLILKIKPIF